MALSGIVNAAKGALTQQIGDIGNFARANNPLAAFFGGVRPGNISDFKSQMTTPAMTTQFDVVINLPQAVRSYILENFEDGIDVDRAIEGLRFKIEAAELPGRSIATSDHKFYGPINKIPYSSTYIDTTFTVINSLDYAETRVFQLWQDYIVGQPNFFWLNFLLVGQKHLILFCFLVAILPVFSLVQLLKQYCKLE